jgi:phosphonate transport system ATP-binding protein
MLSFVGVGKVFSDGTRALQSVTLHVPRGQFCVVLGPSGAGKSTLLRLVNGLVEPSAGLVRVDGVPVTRTTLRAVRPRVAMIHQQFNLSPRLSVAKNVLAGSLPAVSTVRALLHLFPANLRRKACDLIARVGLEPEHLHRRASDLSGGQQQRVGIARAFILDPAVVLADEPVASLDPNISRDILALLRQASKERGATVLCSLHQVDLAREFAERVIGVHSGEIVYDGPAADLDDATLTLIYHQTKPGSPLPAAAAVEAGGRR